MAVQIKQFVNLNTEMSCLLFFYKSFFQCWRQNAVQSIVMHVDIISQQILCRESQWCN